jgi:hypothetical protein
MHNRLAQNKEFRKEILTLALEIIIPEIFG